jgi:hypothetical protein
MALGSVMLLPPCGRHFQIAGALVYELSLFISFSPTLRHKNETHVPCIASLIRSTHNETSNIRASLRPCADVKASWESQPTEISSRVDVKITGTREHHAPFQVSLSVTKHIVTEARDFSLFHAVQTRSEARPLSYPVGKGAIFPGGDKAAGA